MNPAIAGPAVAAGGWALAMLVIMTWLAARHWITAGLLASVLTAGAWGFIASLTLGNADIHLVWSAQPHAWPAMFTYDYAQAWGWVSGEPWELYGLIASIFAWCLLMRLLRKRRLAFRGAAAAAADYPPPVYVPWPPPEPPGRRR